MYFMRDKKKIIFGWSAKCGCSHLKMIYQYLTMNTIDFDKRHQNKKNKLGFIDPSYTIIIVIRNPFIRLISGFLEKYRNNGPFRVKWKTEKILNFNNFVNELVKKSNFIDEHHFCPQLSEEWDSRLENHKNLKIFDLEKIDYKFLEKLYNKKIPENILNYRGHFRTFIMGNRKENMTSKNQTEIYNLPIDHFKDGSSYSYDLYYKPDIKEKVLSYYKKDFDFFKKHGFKYTI